MEHIKHIVHFCFCQPAGWRRKLHIEWFQFVWNFLLNIHSVYIANTLLSATTSELKLSSLLLVCLCLRESIKEAANAGLYLNSSLKMNWTHGLFFFACTSLFFINTFITICLSVFTCVQQASITAESKLFCLPTTIMNKIWKIGAQVSHLIWCWTVNVVTFMINRTLQWFTQDPDVLLHCVLKPIWTLRLTALRALTPIKPCLSNSVQNLTNSKWSFYAAALHIYIYM